MLGDLCLLPGGLGLVCPGVPVISENLVSETAAGGARGGLLYLLRLFWRAPQNTRTSGRGCTGVRGLGHGPWLHHRRRRAVVVAAGKRETGSERTIDMPGVLCCSAKGRSESMILCMQLFHFTWAPAEEREICTLDERQVWADWRHGAAQGRSGAGGGKFFQGRLKTGCGCTIRATLLRAHQLLPCLLPLFFCCMTIT